MRFLIHIIIVCLSCSAIIPVLLKAGSLYQGRRVNGTYPSLHVISAGQVQKSDPYVSLSIYLILSAVIMTSILELSTLVLSLLFEFKMIRFGNSFACLFFS